MDVSRLGTYVKERRTRRGWTQAELAERADVPKQLVTDVERGRSKLPGAEYRRKLANALGVRPVDLLVAAGELAPEEVPGAEMRESSPPYDPDDDRAILIAKINDLPDEAVDSLMVNAIWWEGRIKSRIVGEDADAVPVTSELAFYAGQTDRLRQW